MGGRESLLAASFLGNECDQLLFKFPAEERGGEVQERCNNNVNTPVLFFLTRRTKENENVREKL